MKWHVFMAHGVQFMRQRQSLQYCLNVIDARPVNCDNYRCIAVVIIVSVVLSC